MAYRADIEIAVKGATQLTNLTKQLQAADSVVNRINKNLAAKGLFTGSIENLRSVSAAAERTMRSATAGTYSQKQAIDVYVKSLANAEKAERNLAVAIKQRQRELGIRPTGLGAGRGAGGGRVGGIVSNAIIGGAFPLLFGQGGGAATGGAIGGAVGGLFGGAGGFAGSLLGTLIGERAGRGAQIKELATDIGFTTEQTKLLGTAFQQAGVDFDKFQSSVQNIRGLSLSIEDQADAIRLVSQLTETYGGKIDKVTDAFTSALESGKVTQATLNQLTGQGIPIQDELARKYNVSRDAILQMAKDGKISVQSLADVLVDMGNKGLEAGEKPKSAFDQLTIAVGNTSTAIGNVAATLLNVLAPAIDAIILKATQALNILTETINTELLRTQIQARSGKIVGPEKLKEIETEAMSMAARRFPSQARGRQLAAGPGIISPQAQAEFQIIREQLIRNELQRFGFESGILKAPKPAVSTGIGRITAPSQLTPSGGGGRGRADRTAEEQKRLSALLEQLREQIRIENKSLELQEAISFARADGNEKLVAFIQTQEKYFDIEEKAAKLTRELNAGRIKTAEFILRNQLLGIEKKKVEIQEEQRLNDVFRERYDLTNAIIDAARKAREAAFGQGLGGAGTFRTDMNLMPGLTEGLLGTEFETIKRNLEELVKVENQVAFAAKGIGEAFGQSIKGLVSGSMTAQEALAGFFQTVADRFADMAAQIIAEWVQMQILGIVKSFFGGSSIFPGGVGDFSGAFGGGGGLGSSMFMPGAPSFRAAGGPVAGRTPYIVGERGPELFVPNSSGTIVPNSQLGGMGGDVSVVVNVDASGSNVQGNESQAKALGGAISAAVQAEIIKQQRPGGLLAGTR